MPDAQVEILAGMRRERYPRMVSLNFILRKFGGIDWQEVILLGWHGINKATESGMCQSRGGEGRVICMGIRTAG